MSRSVFVPVETDKLICSNHTDRLRRILISSGIQVTEACIELETSPRLDPWAWFTGAHQQYHYALLLLTVIFAFPTLPEADRIWNCLDYVFEVPPHMTQEQKSRWILTEVRDRTELFANSRKVRAPLGLTDPLAKQTPLKPSGPNDPYTVGVEARRFQSSQVDLTQTGAAAEAMHNQYIVPHEGRGVPRVFYSPTSIPMPTVPLIDDRMGEIDWVMTPG